MEPASDAKPGETPAHGQNEPQIEDDAVIAVNLSKIRVAADQAASGHGTYRSVLAHAEAKGVHLKAAKRALAIVKAGDDAVTAWLEENAAVTKYLRIMRHGIQQSQLDMFETEASLAPIDEKAGLDGLAAGRDGQRESNNPHDLSTPAGQAWLSNYRTGAHERDVILSMGEPQGDGLIKAPGPQGDDTSFEDDHDE